MNDRTLGMILPTVIAAPVVMMCCGGALALLGSALAGLAGLLSGMGDGHSGLLAIGVGILLLALFVLQRRTDVRGQSNPVPESRS